MSSFVSLADNSDGATPTNSTLGQGRGGSETADSAADLIASMDISSYSSADSITTTDMCRVRSITKRQWPGRYTRIL